MGPMTLETRRRYLYLLTLLFVALVPLIALYTSGYRLGPGFSLVETGGIYIYSPEPGAEIVVNDKKRGETSLLNRDIFIQNLKPGVYTVFVSKEGFWPWGKEITVEEKKVSEAITFLIPKEIAGSPIPKEISSGTGTSSPLVPNPLYKQVSLYFNTAQEKPAVASTSPIELISYKKHVGIWRDGQKIYAEWLGDPRLIPSYYCTSGICENIIFVFDAIGKITSIAFYPKREDVLLLAIGNGIYALEVDVRKFQNFQPIYKGIAPSFVVNDEGFFIKDAGNLFSVDI